MAGWWSKVTSFWESLSVEPIALVYYFCVYLSTLGVSNFYLQKTCSPEAQPLDTNAVCYDTKRISESSDLNTVRTMMRTCIPGLIVLLAGAWRDRTGLTRPLLLLIICGEILATVVMLFGVFYWSSSSWIFGCIDSIIAGFTGGQPLFSMASNCHISENSSPETRTARFAYYVGSILIAGILSSAIGGIILSALGYKYFFILIIGLQSIAIFLTILFIKNNPGKDRKSQSLLKMSTIKNIFTKKENVYGIWMTIISSCAINSAIHGEMNVFLYYMEQGFQYSVTQAGYISSYRMLVEALGSIIMSTILSKILKVNDYKIIVLSAVITFVSSIALTFSVTIGEICTFTFLGVFKPTLVSALRSTISKLVNSEETGMFFGFESVFSAFLPAITFPAYDYAFNKTVDFLPGGFFLVSASLEFVIVIFACAIFWKYGRKQSSDIDKEEVAKDMQKCSANVDDSDNNFQHNTSEETLP